MALKSGLGAQLGYAAETTWGTAVTVTKFIPFLNESLQQQIENLSSEAIVSGQRILRSGQWVQGRHTIAGDLGLELYDRGMTRLLHHALGSITSSAAAGVATHTMTPGDMSGLGLTVQVGRPDRAGTCQPFTYAGIKVASWELAVNTGEIATLGLSVVGYSETTGTALATATYGATSPAPFSYLGGSFSLAGSSLCVRSAKIAGDNGLDTDRLCIGQNSADEPLEAAYREYTGEVELEFPDLVHYNRFIAGTEGALVLSIARGTSTFTVTANVRTDGSTPTVQGTGMLVHTLNFKCMGTNDAHALTMTLVNGETSP